MVRHLPSTNLAIPSLISGNRITLEHGLKHHFGTQPILPHFGTKARTQPLYHPLWKIMEFVRWDHSSHMVPVTYSQIPWFQSPPTRFRNLPPTLGPFAPRPSRNGHDFPHGGAPHLLQLRDLTMTDPWPEGVFVLEGDEVTKKNGFNIRWMTCSGLIGFNMV
jgi:hypothetical protein